MPRLLRLGTCLAIGLLWTVCSWSAAQNEKAAAAQPTGPFRKLAPGVMKPIDTTPEVKDTHATHDVVELLAVDPKFDWAKEQTFRRDVWYLDFQFKPLRIVNVDIPQPGGKMKQTRVYYMVYTVTNPGKALHPVKQDDGTYSIEYVDKPVRFVPEFVIESPEFKFVYPERVIPLAVPIIENREDANRKLLNTVEMCREIGVGETLWGVATWDGIDPRIDHFEIYLQGLTNAYQWEDQAGAVKPGDPVGTGRRLAKKTLRINFWRPGDEFFVNEREIRYGMPGKVDYDWVYR